MTQRKPSSTPTVRSHLRSLLAGKICQTAKQSGSRFVAVSAARPEIGIAAIGIYEPAKHELNLPNEWYERHGVIGKRFAVNTGVQVRGISFLNEREMAMRAIAELRQKTRLDFRRCAGVVLSSCSLIPETADWRKNCIKALGDWDVLNETIGPLTGIPRETLQAWAWNDELLDWDRLNAAARVVGITEAQVATIARTYMQKFGSLEETAKDIAVGLGLSPDQARGVNSGCSGFVKAWETAQTGLAEAMAAAPDSFILLLTASRHSKYIDFGASDTGALFGDFATATLVTRADHPSHPARLVLRRQTTALPEARTLSPDGVRGAGILFDYERRKHVLRPEPDGSEGRDAERVCWTMDGPGVVYAASPAFLGALDQAVAASGVRYEDIDWCLGHQPGEKLAHRATDGLRKRAYCGELPMSLTRETGNITCSSIPHALHSYWDRLHGIVACPAMGMHAPGSDRMSQGCLLFEVRN
jgi:3-oxoacyl-[acyl-carrier-protein] synthase III